MEATGRNGALILRSDLSGFISSTGLTKVLNIGSGNHRRCLLSISLLWFPGEMIATSLFLLSRKLPVSQKLTLGQINFYEANIFSANAEDNMLFPKREMSKGCPRQFF